MKRLVRNIVVAVLGVGLVGCEWSGSNSDNSWNDSNSLANFSGHYVGWGNGGYLVSQYSTASSSTPGGTTTIPGESVGTGDGVSTTFGGTLAHPPVVPGSLAIVAAGGFSFHDNGNGTLTGSSGTSGTIVYQSGGWNIDLHGGILANGAAITASYAVTNSGSQGSNQGSTDPIYAFNVQQDGNKLKIIDNNGSVYSGSFGNFRTTGNLDSNSQNPTFVNGDQVLASFSASGTSAAGMHVNMTGTFQGIIEGVSTVTSISGDKTVTKTSMVLNDRLILGTWVEDGGKTGDIKGNAPSVTQVIISSNTTNSPSN